VSEASTAAGQAAVCSTTRSAVCLSLRGCCCCGFRVASCHGKGREKGAGGCLACHSTPDPFSRNITQAGPREKTLRPAFVRAKLAPSHTVDRCSLSSCRVTTLTQLPPWTEPQGFAHHHPSERARSPFDLLIYSFGKHVFMTFTNHALGPRPTCTLVSTFIAFTT
jgi:hypothetical protein